MRINTNISALRASNNLNKTNNALSKSLERLSSGYRINKAADDAAGLAIAQKMRTQIAGLEQADRNSSDGISLIQTAEGALVEVQSMAQRIRELSVQAANGTNTDSDRVAIQAEIDELTEEMERISETTEFNTLNLLDGSCDRKSFSDQPKVSLVSSSESVTVGKYKLEITQDARQAVLYGMNLSWIDAQTPKEVKEAQAGTININGVDVLLETGDTMEEVYAKIREGCEKVNIDVFPTTATAPSTADTAIEAGACAETAYYTTSQLTSSSRLVFVTKEYGSDQEININCSNATLIKKLANDSTNPTAGLTAKGVDVVAKFPSDRGDYTKTATISASGNMITVTDQNGFELEFEAERLGTDFGIDVKIGSTTAATSPAAMSDQIVTTTVLSAGSLKLQVGANEGQVVEVAIQKINPKTLGINNINVKTDQGAQSAITACDVAINKISELRSKLGAYQNRLEHTVTNLGVASENMTEALSRIEDTDMASEMATYTQNNVLTQAGTSMLAQANQLPQQILSLLNA